VRDELFERQLFADARRDRSVLPLLEKAGTFEKGGGGVGGAAGGKSGEKRERALGVERLQRGGLTTRE